MGSLALLFAIIGIILVIIGVAWFEYNKRNLIDQSFWVYFLMLFGILILVVSLVYLGWENYSLKVEK